ncbi:MFS transporter [Aliiglaciecola litoralis]|uniref:MFS transporter n=1 Tax=Aliiglaciecola litoralis TaxID=582857 RepID=A0ABN1LS59_9ALTE
MSHQANSAPLSFKEKLGYGLGDMASNFYLGFFGLYLLYYYTDVYGLAPAAVGVMLLVSKIIDAVSDPVMGLVADRTESRWGKYRPYLLWAAIPYGLLGFAIFFGPNFSDTGKLIYAYVTYIGVMLAFTAVNVPYSALLAVISPLAEERTKATTYRFIGAGAGGILIAAFATPLVSWLGGGDDVLGFRLTMAIFAVLSVGLFWITFASTKERIKLPPHDSSARKDLKLLFKNTSWVLLAISCVLIVVGLIARFSSIIFYVKYYMHDDGEAVFLIFDRVALFSAIGLAGQIVGAFITPYLTKFFSKHHLVLIMCLLHTVLLIIGYFVAPDMFWTAVLLNCLGITTFGVVITLLFAMFTDCAEYGEWQTGKRTSGLTVSASMFALKFGSALGGAIPGFILGYVGFVANEALSDATMDGIRMMATLLPAALFALGGLLMLFYKIDKTLLVRIEKELRQRRKSLPQQ